MGNKNIKAEPKQKNMFFVYLALPTRRDFFLRTLKAFEVSVLEVGLQLCSD